jgi:hypothetical protein
MGFSLQEAQWLVKFYQSLPGQARAAADADQFQNAQYMEPQHADYVGDGYMGDEISGYYDDYR